MLADSDVCGDFKVNKAKDLAFKLFCLACLALACGTLANLFLPMRIPWVEDWAHYIEARALREGLSLAPLDVARDAAKSGSHLLLDARPAVDYDEGHIPSAISLPFNAMEDAFENVRVLLTSEQPVITYCSGLECDDSFMLALFLREQGFTNVVLFAEGFEAWEKAGYPVEK